MCEKIIWFDARNLKNKEKILTLIANKSFEYIVINYNMLETIKTQKKMTVIVEITEEDQLTNKLENKIILSRKLSILDIAKKNMFKTAFATDVSSEDEMNQAWLNGVNYDYLLVEFKDPTNIPLELILARMQNRKTSVLKKVYSLEQTKIAFGVMGNGSDGVLLETENINEIIEVDNFMNKRKMTKLNLVNAKVTEVRHLGMGKRVCVDTIDKMSQKEGMIVGSTSNGGVLISSETHFLPYMDLRPFRVNAGALHSYVWGPDNMSPYLSDLRAGSKLLCVDTDGNAREIVVGRVKMETRPLLMICAEAEGQTINCIVQDDWHIRIFGAKGEVLNASEIKIGNELAAYVCASGRHVGIKIDEDLYEK
jgi:3-dehydroquinate synthase II/3-amino-4-hydroxybenzoic acid synthase